MDLTVVGMISGTSFDAVDVAAADLSLRGDTVWLAPRGARTGTIPDGLRARIAALLPPAATTIEEVCRLDTELGQLFGAVAAEAISALAPGGADLVVSHGQTVYHWVSGDRALGTLQLGAAAWIAEATGAATLTDMRSRDIARGGHGAPLASTLDALLLLDGSGGSGAGPRRGSLNLGGIANITVRSDDGAIIAYDLGPANALMDAAVVAQTGGAERMDAGGARAARGRVDEPALATLLDEDYYRLPAPKSTGRELFDGGYVARRLGAGAPSGDDLLATLCELSARLVADACSRHALTELVVAGGGASNPALTGRIAALAPGVSVRGFDAFGIPADAKEAYLFALLGYLSVHGLPATIPSATGARAGSVLGSLTPGPEGFSLPAPVAEAVAHLRVGAPS